MTIPPKGPYATLYSNYAGVIFQGSAPSPEETEESSIGIQASPSTATEASQTSGESTQSEVRSLERRCQQLEKRCLSHENLTSSLQSEIALQGRELFETRCALDREKRKNIELESDNEEKAKQIAALKSQLALLKADLLAEQELKTALLEAILEGPIPEPSTSGQPPAKRARPSDDDNQPGTSKS